MRHAVILIHGIGNQKENWAKNLILQLQNKILSNLNSSLQTKAPKKIDDAVSIRSVYWKDVLKKPEDALDQILDKYYKNNTSKVNCLFNFVSGVLRSFNKIQNKITTEFIGDITGYLTPEIEVQVHTKVKAALDAFSVDVGIEGKMPLTIISHSLGTVITSNFVYDLQKERGFKYFHESFLLSNLFTVGSPIALFSLRAGGPDMFRKPINVECPEGRWLNILDKNDPIAMPLRPLNDEYSKVVFSDKQVNAGFYGFAHTQYFDKTNTLDFIARKLAIDWIAINKILPDVNIQTLYKEYDKAIS